jgi:hypothetical protein
MQGPYYNATHASICPLSHMRRAIVLLPRSDPCGAVPEHQNSGGWAKHHSDPAANLSGQPHCLSVSASQHSS